MSNAGVVGVDEAGKLRIAEELVIPIIARLAEPFDVVRVVSGGVGTQLLG